MSDSETVIFLCREDELTRERLGYFKSFSDLGYKVLCSGDILYIKGNPILNNKVKLIIQPEASPILPFDIFDLKIPVACFQIDTNLATIQRAKASKVFDYTFVFHPGFESLFRTLGVANTFLLPHAIERDLFLINKQQQVYDIGWVGRTDGDNYKSRREILPILQSKYIMNDPFKKYSQKELLEIYSKSKIIVNISKDDYLEDANIRCFEAMASGALLFTHTPSELTDLGFEEGIHFIGFNKLVDLTEKLDFYLCNPEKIQLISEKAREKVLKSHTYHTRAETIMKTIESYKDENVKIGRESKILQGFIYFFCFRRDIHKALFLYKKLPLPANLKFNIIRPLLKLIISKIINREHVSFFSKGLI